MMIQQHDLRQNPTWLFYFTQFYNICQYHIRSSWEEQVPIKEERDFTLREAQTHSSNLL